MGTTYATHCVDNGTYEFLFAPVPAEQRKPSNQLISILLGFSFAISGIAVGVQLGRSLPLAHALAVSLAGNLFLFLIALFWGILGYRSGCTISCLIKSLLGGKIAYIFSFFLVFAVVVWVSINGEWCANSVITYFPNWPLPRAVTIPYMLLLIILPSLKGWKALTWISRICVPLIVVLTVWHIIWMGTISQGFTIQQPVSAAGLTVSDAFTFVVGDFMLSSVFIPDVCRFSKNKQTVWGCTVVYALTLIISNIVGILLAMASGAHNLIYGTYLLHLLLPSFCWLFLCVFTTQGLNIYAGSLAMQSLLNGTRLGGNVSCRVTVLLLGCLSMLISSIGITRYLSSFVRILTIAVITLTEIAMIEVVLKKKRKPVNQDLPFFCWLLSIAVGGVILVFAKWHSWLMILTVSGIAYTLFRGKSHPGEPNGPSVL